ncbi:class I SAM-dependent methyltransferase [Natronomonas sp. EA1]|uniref:class I SAM-dependent methyltransferase n=1 Tax=Natronomonas sp. EA1 TaxID=3421655 RepID=UPI003EBC2DDE
MSVAEFYGRYAGLYDRIATLPGVGRWRAALADALALEPGDTVVEMGCGTGANLPYLRERVGSDGTVVGIDLTGPLLEVARARTSEYDNVHLLRGDATRPPIPDADAVVASFVSGMFRDPAGVVAGWCTLVGPGGRVALLDAAVSDDPVGRLLNPAFRAFTRGTAPAPTTLDAVWAALDLGREDPLEPRVNAARKALAARTTERRFEAFALGFVGLLRGRVR